MDEKTIPYRSALAGQPPPALAPNQTWADNLPYRALFEQTWECIFIISLDFHYIAANQQALDLLGYQEHELVDRPVDEVVSLGSSEEIEVPNDLGSHLQERVLKRKDGTTVPVEISTSIVYNDRNEPAYIQSIARDISARKHTERQLRRNALILAIISEATAKLLQSSDFDTKLHSLLESLGRALDIAGCAIFTLDGFSGAPASRVRYLWTRAAAALAEGEIAATVDPYVQPLLRTNHPFYSDAGLDGQNPAARGLSFVAIPIEGAIGAKGYLGFFDAAENLLWSRSEMDALQTAANLVNAALQRRQYEETIRLSEVRNRILVDALPDLIIRVGLDGNILDYSANPDHPLYIHRDLACGRKLDKTFPAEVVALILGEGPVGDFASPRKVDEFRLPYANNTYEARLYPICADEALIVIRDVTEEARLNQMKSDFINRASHELRTPLTSALLMVDLIQEGGTDEEVDDCWRTLKAELNRQKDLIDRLLMAGRLESGMMHIASTAIDLLPVLEESLRSVQPIAARRNVRLNLTHAEAGYRVWGDTGGLQQVFINLVNNAAKFSPEGSVVEIELAQTGAQVRVAIIDKGMGIPPEDLPHLFNRFYRARNVTVAEIPGSGIGLYIVQSIVKELGGEIEVQSLPNQGTTFTVCLRRVQGG